ncbi:JAB domain-containing protein [Methylomagnum sp.]
MKSPINGQIAPKIRRSPSTQPAAIPNFRVCEKSGRYVTRKPLTDEQIIQAAKRLLERRVFRDTPALTSPTLAADYLTLCLASYESEVFGLLLLDSQNRPLAFEQVSQGTVAYALVHPREVVKAVLRHNAVSVVLAHNHPSGSLKPSEADHDITRALKSALAVIGVSVLDHFIVGGGRTFSFAEHGLLDGAPPTKSGGEGEAHG